MKEEPCLFISVNYQCIIYVDDAIVAAESEALIEDFYKSIKTSFALKIIGEPKRLY